MFIICVLLSLPVSFGLVYSNGRYIKDIRCGEIYRACTVHRIYKGIVWWCLHVDMRNGNGHKYNIHPPTMLNVHACIMACNPHSILCGFSMVIWCT